MLKGLFKQREVPKYLEMPISLSLKSFINDFISKFEDVELSEDQYKGGQVEDLRSGEGCQLDKDGTVYKGSWLKDKRQGNGQQWFSDNSLYQGEWVNDKPHGKGIMLMPNGNLIEASFIGGALA